MADYKAALKAILSGKGQVWLEGEGDLVDGVKLIQDALLTDDLRAAFLKAVDGVPPPPPPPSTDPFETMIVDTDELNIRPSPDIQHTATGKLVRGDTLVVQGKITSTDSSYVFAALVSVNGLKATGGYVARKYLKPAPPPPPPGPTATGFKIGAHIMWGGNYDQLTAWAQTGKLPGVTNVKTAGRGDHLLNQTLKQASGGKTLILQRWYNPNDPLPGPDWSKPDLTDVGKAYFNAYYDLYLRNDPDGMLADYHQIINEPTGIGPGVASFWLGAMQAAEARNCKLAVGCYSVGFPLLPSAQDGLAFWQPMWDMLRYAKAHGHAWMRHGYIVPDVGGSWTDEQYMLRHRLELTPADLRDTAVIYGEYGTANGAHMSDDVYLNGVKSAQAELSKDANVLFVSLWTAGGGGGWPDSLIDGKLPRLIDYAKSY